MSKNDKQQQSNAGAAASPSRSTQKVLDSNRRFIDDYIRRWARSGERGPARYRKAVLTTSGTGGFLREHGPARVLRTALLARQNADSPAYPAALNAFPEKVQYNEPERARN